MSASERELRTIRTKAESIRTRNNRIESLVSALHPDPRNENNSILIKQYSLLTDERKTELWEQAMTLLAEQFSSIQELIGMTR